MCWWWVLCVRACFWYCRNEIGTYYALDLGGTNFRVLRVHLGGERSTIVGHEVERQPIPQHLMTSTTEVLSLLGLASSNLPWPPSCILMHALFLIHLQELFGFIALTLKRFVERETSSSNLPLDKKREMGFTFSFPVRQTSASSGILIKWTKGFSIGDMVNITSFITTHWLFFSC